MSSSGRKSAAGLRFGRALHVVIALVLGAAAVARAESGHWEMVRTEGIESSSNKPCEAGMEYVNQGTKGKVLAVGPNSLTLGTYAHWVKDPFWIKSEMSWQPFPARLDPGQKIQWTLKAAWIVNDPRPAPNASAFICRKSGIGGEQDELGRVAVPTRGGSKQAATKMHVVPAGPAAKGQYLVYFHGGRDVTGGCDFTSYYAWVGDGSKPSASGFQREPKTDRPGGDYRKMVDVADAGKCEKICVDDGKCRAFTWVRPGVLGPKPICFLKNSVPPARPGDCCESGTRR